MDHRLFNEVMNQREVFVKRCDHILRHLFVLLYQNGLSCSRKELFCQLVDSMNVHERKIYRKLDVLRKMFRITAMVNFKALDLVRVFFFLDKTIEFNAVPLKDWLYVYGNIISPKGVLLIYYVPRDNVGSVVDVLMDKFRIKDQDNVFISIDTILPEIELYDENIVFILPVDEIDDKKTSYSCFNSVKYDYIDLLIIKELEKNPLIRFDELAKNIRISKGKVIKHFREHVCRYKLIKKIVPEFIIDKTEYFINLLMRVRLTGNEVIPSIFTKLNSFYTLHVGIDNRSFIFSTRLSMSGLIDFTNKLKDTSSNLGFFYTAYLVNPLTLKKFTIPYEKYLRNEHRWSDPVKEIS